MFFIVVVIIEVLRSHVQEKLRVVLEFRIVLLRDL